MNTFSNPIKIVEQLPVSPGDHVADLGAGSGSYTMALAEKLKGSSSSKVFAIDVQKDLLNRISKQAEDLHLGSVYIVWGDIEEARGSRLREDSIDMAIIANTLFQVQNKNGLLEEAYRILKPGGRLVLIDWIESFGSIGPKASEVISLETAQLLCEEAGFSFDHTIDAGSHHYGFITRKI